MEKKVEVNFMVELLGYSERGMINILLTEICFRYDEADPDSDRPKELFRKLLSRCCFPACSAPFDFTVEKILIEQSFSDFGDADIVFLGKNLGRKSAIFAEAKIFQKNQASCGRLRGELDSLRKMVEKIYNFHSSEHPPTKISSNLYVQLYFKMKMVSVLKDELIDTGVKFPDWSSKKTRKIGKNDVVRHAVEELKDYCVDCDNIFYLAIVPDKKNGDANDFIQNDLPLELEKLRLSKWQKENFGILTWEDVAEFCNENRKLTRSAKVFKHNKGQIF